MQAWHWLVDEELIGSKECYDLRPSLARHLASSLPKTTSLRRLQIWFKELIALLQNIATHVLMTLMTMNHERRTTQRYGNHHNNHKHMQEEYTNNLSTPWWWQQVRLGCRRTWDQALGRALQGTWSTQGRYIPLLRTWRSSKTCKVVGTPPKLTSLSHNNQVEAILCCSGFFLSFKKEYKNGPFCFHQHENHCACQFLLGYLSETLSVSEDSCQHMTIVCDCHQKWQHVDNMATPALAPAVLQLNLASALEDSKITVRGKAQRVPKAHWRLHLERARRDGTRLGNPWLCLL